jgi:hypothetical protein
LQVGDVFNNHIAGLQVPVDVVLGVNVFQPQEDSFDGFGALFLCQGLVVSAPLLDEVSESPSLHVLDCQDNVVHEFFDLNLTIYKSYMLELDHVVVLGDAPQYLGLLL